MVSTAGMAYAQPLPGGACVSPTGFNPVDIPRNEVLFVDDDAMHRAGCYGDEISSCWRTGTLDTVALMAIYQSPVTNQPQ